MDAEKYWKEWLEEAHKKTLDAYKDIAENMSDAIKIEKIYNKMVTDEHIQTGYYWRKQDKS